MPTLLHDVVSLLESLSTYQLIQVAARNADLSRKRAISHHRS